MCSSEFPSFQARNGFLNEEFFCRARKNRTNFFFLIARIFLISIHNVKKLTTLNAKILITRPVIWMRIIFAAFDFKLRLTQSRRFAAVDTFVIEQLIRLLEES